MRKSKYVKNTHRDGYDSLQQWPEAAKLLATFAGLEPEGRFAYEKIINCVDM